MKRTLLRAARTGSWGDFRHRTVDATHLRDLCRSPEHVDPRGLMIRNAKIAGRLDLSGMDVPFPLRFEACAFTEPPLFDGAQLHELALLRCELSEGLLANGLRVTRDLDLSRSVVGGALWTPVSTSKQSAIWLCEAEIGGRLLCVATRIRPGGVRAIHADRLRVAGTVRLINGFEAHGEVRLLGAQLDGSLDMTGARVHRPDGVALDLADMTLGGSVFLIGDAANRKPVIEGRIDMGATRIGGQMIVRDAEIIGTAPLVGPYASHRGSGTAISAPRAAVNGSLSFEGACRVRGGVDFSLGEFGFVHVTRDCVLDAAGGVALDLRNADLRSSVELADGVTVRGSITLDGASVGGNLLLRGVHLAEPGAGPLLSARSARVLGDVEAQRLRAEGGSVDLRGAEVGNNLDLEAATLFNPERFTLYLHNATINGSVRLDAGFSSDGEVRLSRTTIGGRLDLRGGVFTDRDGHAIEAEGLVSRGGMYLGWTECAPSVNLTGAQTTTLADDPDTWPPTFLIRGFTYERFGPLTSTSPPNWDAGPRIAWLARQTAFEAGPYEHAARVFREHGHLAAAEEVLISQRRHARHAATRQAGAGPRIRLWALMDRLYSLFGYGYRPGRAGWPLVALLAAVFVLMLVPSSAETLRATDPRGNVYTATGRLVTVSPVGPAAPGALPDRVGDYSTDTRSRPSPDPCGDGQVRCFNAFFYAVDTVVPLVSTGQRATWYPDTHTPGGEFLMWFLNIATLLGWVLSSVLVFSFARLARSV
ncbi:bactofilin family protein [Actinophytocola sp. KF-1]